MDQPDEACLASGMTLRIVFDGLNLALSQGTGIATYTRILTRIARDLGHEVGIVYSTPFTPPKNALLREVAFFDEKRLPNPVRRKMTLRRLLDDALAQARYHFPVRPQPVALNGTVVTRQIDHTLPAQDRVFVARNLFANTRTYFSRTGSLVELAFTPRPDLLHCTYPMPLRVKSACNLYTIHDLVPLRLPFMTLDDKRQIFRMLKTIADRADHIVTVSEHSKRDIVALLGVDERRVTNTYQSIDIPEEYLARPETAIANQLQGAFGLEPDGYLLFYGALEPKKNVARLVEAYLASGVAVPLVVVLGKGWQNEAETRLLAEQSQNGRGEARIRRLEYLDFATLVALIRGARAVVFPSLYEGFGLPVLEAMALGAPVVSSSAAALPEIAGDAALLVDPYDSDAIRRAITTIVADADLRAELSRRGRQQAAKFSLARYRERVAALYAALR
ncbi:MAG TPA: glycosyltransferase family 1 protein [Stellaceae bacterium]|nr:glycosyltransferase family 1 protein [Stellaceae bacterium]